MSRTVTVKDVIIGEGTPKICVSILGTTVSELVKEAEAMKSLAPDLVEWRTDFFENIEEIESVQEALNEIHTVIPDLPLIFTFRSAKEGGQKEIETEYYIKLNRAAAESGLVDIIDVELFNDEADIKTLITAAHDHNTFVIISNHDFHGTPARDEIVSRLRKAQELGGDLPKIAVMPNHPGDVLTLLEATYIMKQQYADRPIITMSMAGEGVITRLAGEVFGSALTFGAAHKASAPGQVPAAEMRDVLSLLHRNLS